MGIGFIFPGQGSQSIGMMSAIADEAVVKETFEEASDALSMDLWKLVQDGPESDLNLTQNTQPAMLAAGIATWRVWQSAGGPAPELVAGHSLGEYSALVCARAVAFKDAVRLVAARGRFMQEAVPAGTGAMAAVLGLDDAKVIEVCQTQAGTEVVEAVNFNCPGQVVVAGHAAAVDRVIDAATKAGATKVVKLALSVPSHCALMKPAAERLGDMLQDVEMSAPVSPVIHNADVTSYTDVMQIKDALVHQLYSPVRWVETIQFMKSKGIDQLIECGPGKVLTGLNRRIERRMPISALTDKDAIDKAISACETSAGA